MGFFGRRKIPRLNELLPEEEGKISSLPQDSQTIPWEDDSKDIGIGLLMRFILRVFKIPFSHDDSKDIDTGLLIELYEEAVRKEPHEFIYHYILGATYFSRGELEKAREIWEKASSLKPDDSRPLYDLGAIYYGIWDARKEEETGTTKEQVYKRFEEGLSDPFLPDDLRQQGEEIVREFEYSMFQLDDETSVRLRLSCRKSPTSRESAKTNALYYFRKTLACQLHREDRKAVEQHRKLIEIQEALLF